MSILTTALRAGAALALAGACLVAQAAAAFDLDQLMAALAQYPGGRARFVETRTLALLDRPVRASGELRYTPPDRLEKHTLQPREETLVLDGDLLTVERDQRRLRVNIASRPEARAFVESIRSTLAGNRQALEQHYRLQLGGTLAAWTLALEPRDAAVQALVSRITVTGQGGEVRRIEYAQADGDRSQLDIEPIAP